VAHIGGSVSARAKPGGVRCRTCSVYAAIEDGEHAVGAAEVKQAMALALNNKRGAPWGDGTLPRFYPTPRTPLGPPVHQVDW
jgi:hypothetical protein